MSKKRIIAIISIIVLLFAAGISVGVFLHSRGETEAADGSQAQSTTDQNQVVDGNQTTDGTQIGDNNENSTTNPNEGDENDENTETPDEGTADGAENDETVENDNEAADNDAVNNNEVVADNDNNNENAEVTTDTNVNEVGETTITRVEEQERLVSQAFLDWWKPMEVTLTKSNVDVNVPQIEVNKTATTGVGGDKFVYAGQDITYVISVTNNSSEDVENIEVTDKIPQNTTFVSFEDAVILSEVDGKLTSEVVGIKTTVESDNVIAGVKWTVTIPAGETIIAKFTVNVNEAIGTISNVAIANGEESKDPTNTPGEGTETKTAIITSNKTSVITRNDEVVQTAKVGDLITYTITVENTGDVEGTTYIEDTVPEGTIFVSAHEGAIVSETKDTVSWSITLGAKETITREFTVEVTSVNGPIVNIADVGGTDTNPDTTETAGITVNKDVVSINGVNVENTTESIEVKENDVIGYRITVTNNGSKNLKDVNIVEYLDIDVTEGQLNIGKLASGEEVVIEAIYTVSHEKDIQGKKDKKIKNTVDVSGITVEEDGKQPETVTDTTFVETDVETVKTLEVVKEVTSTGTGAEGKYGLGDTVSYKVTVTNKGNQTITGIKLADKVNETTDIETANFKDSKGTVTENVTLSEFTFTLAPNESAYFEYNYTVVEADIAKGEITNVVTATAPETKPGTDTEEVDTVDTIPLTDVTLEKNVVEETDKEFKLIASDKVYAIGDNVWYSISVTNNHLALGSITVTDILPLGMTYVGSTEKIQDAWAVNVGKYDAEKHTLTWEISNLAPRETKTIYINTRITEKSIEGITPTTSETETLRTKLYEIKNIVIAQQQRDEVEITVKEEIELTSVSVTKIWVDSTTTHDSVTVQLYKDETAVGQPIELSEENWSHTWSKLIKKDGEKDIVYTVKETKFGTENVVNNETSKYVSTQTSNGNTITITNTRKPEIVATKSATTKDVNGKDVTCTAPMTAENAVPVQIGDTIKYKITVQNIGGLVAEDVKVQDTNPTHTLPENGTSLKVNVAFNDGTSTPLTNEEVNKFKNGTYTIDIPAFTTVTFTFTVKVSEGNPKDKIENTAYVDGKSVGPTIHSIEKIVKVTKYKNNVASSNIVLVLDVSSSMKKNKDGDDTTRIEDAKSAIVQFINDTYAIKENENVTFTLVTFADRNYTDRLGDDANGVGGIFEFNDNGDYIATKANQIEFINAVNSIATDSGTNMRAGLEVAEKVLYGYSDANGNAVTGIAQMEAYKNYEQLVIFFGDGNPSGSDSLNTAKGIKQKADDIRNDRKGSNGKTIKGAKIFSIGFGTHISNTDSNGYKILSSISNDGKVYTSTTSVGLVQNFATIIGSDPEYSQYTVDGKAIIEITLDSQEITVSKKYPIIIKVDGVETPIITNGSNNVTFTTKKITWDVSSFKDAKELEISYYVQ